MNRNTNEIPIQEPSARELHIVEFIAGLDCQLAKGGDILEARLRNVPDLWRQYRIAMKATQKVIEGIYKTVPIKTLRHMQNLCKYGEIVIRPRPATPVDDVQIVPTQELKLLINKVIENECAMCIKDQREQRRCKLRRAMMVIAPPQEVNREGCNYRDVVAGNDLGEYI